MLLYLCRHGPYNCGALPTLAAPRRSRKSRDGAHDPAQTSLPQPESCKGLITLQNRTCPRTRILPAARPGAQEERPGGTSTTSCSRAKKPLPGARKPAARRGLCGEGRCPECWAMPREGTRATSDTCLKAFAHPWRPSRDSHDLTSTISGGNPLYGTLSQRCKRAVKCGASLRPTRTSACGCGCRFLTSPSSHSPDFLTLEI